MTRYLRHSSFSTRVPLLAYASLSSKLAACDGIAARRQNTRSAELVEQLVRGDENCRTFEPGLELVIEEWIGTAMDKRHNRSVRVHMQVGRRRKGPLPREDPSHE